MNRRLLLRVAALLAASSIPSRAQKQNRVPVMAILRTTTDVQLAVQIDVYRDGLRRFGYVEGTTIQFDNPSRSRTWGGAWRKETGKRKLTTKIDHGRLVEWRPSLFLDLKQPVSLSSSA